MKGIMILFCAALLLTLVSATGQQDVFVITLNYNAGNVSLGSLEITKGVFYPSISVPKGEYNLTIYSAGNDVLYSQLFSFPLQRNFMPSDPSWFDSQGNQVGFGSDTSPPNIQTTTLEIIIPYFEDAALIEIRDNSGVNVLTIPLKDEFAPTTSVGTVTNGSIQIPCILIECTYAPKTCPKWGTQDKTCINSCTKKKSTQKISCTPIAGTEVKDSAGFWKIISEWFKKLFSS